ncbi:MAG: hypothetical protein KKF46_07215 [Nanoarchaeota archaeon]|nr:hypothetical protein [Nanoarchaeota archaeon]MBU1322117.1 hypothetical protein [Nanoarchaeota archaeon]MBU1597438.1 hypothetical protein [Nanoarchaeota archaeon]MBU2441607.1 hypothetical protein [Nanoarchaeota archaeon]
MVHSIKESDLELLCPKCRTKHNSDLKWIPEFWKEVHYRTLLCTCGYKVSIRTNGFHSGHY